MKLGTLILVAALTVASLASAPAFGSEMNDVLAVVSQYSDHFSKNDMKAADSLCTDHTVIIDDFSPHVWQGATACADWSKAFVADNKSSGIAFGIIKLGKPWKVTVTAERAYAVFPITYTFKHNGNPTTSQGVWTFALQKVSVGWRIAGWAFSLHP